jgi:DNA invertase Pin-like site-specific DNA recombinase
MRAFLYCRVAHEDSFALEHQRFLLQLYAKQAGYTIIGAADEYGSGLTLDRPALQKV